MTIRVGYYPGCSAHGMARSYDASTRAVFASLGVDLVEIPKWNCCGSTPAYAESALLSACLSARNLVLAEKAGLEQVMTPCAACFSHLRAAKIYAEDQEGVHQIEEVIGQTFNNRVQVRSSLDLLVNQVGLDALANQIKRPLNGLRVVPYYGCLLTRPEKVAQFDHPTNPSSLDRLLEVLGAEVAPWGAKTDCCGASYSITAPEVTYRLGGHILSEAKTEGAELIVSACPLCQPNLELRQPQIARASGQDFGLPVVYFTELVGLAMGMEPARSWLKKHLVSPIPTLVRHGLLAG